MNIQCMAVLIASRNRPEKLFNLLKSIDLNDCLPGQVILVSSGDFPEILKNKTWKFELIHQHVDFSGQVLQKSFGLDFILKKMNWVLFLDDDVYLEKNFFTKLSFENHDSSVLGFALNHNIFYSKSFINRTHNYIYAKKRGSLSRSGQPINYIGADSNIEIKWTNGLSIWSTSIINLYKLNPPSKSYSAYEDVIFSYRISKFGKIVFLHNIFVYSQEKTGLRITLANYITSVYMRYYFVKSNKEFSLFLLVVNEFFRAINAILSGDKSVSFCRRLIQVSAVFVDFLIIVILRKNPRILLVSKNLI